MSPVLWKGPQKVAALLYSLDPDLSSEILSQMSENEMAEVGAAMTTLDPAEMTEEAFGELHKEFVKAMLEDTGPEAPPPPPMAQVLEELLGKALPPDRAKQMRAKIESTSKKSRPFIQLEKLKIDLLRKTLEGEHPQVIALVCSRMSSDSTALVLGGMEDAVRNDVVRRMAVLDNPKEELIRELVTALEAKANSFKPAAAEGGEAAAEEEVVDPQKKLRAVVDILKTVDVEVEKSILANLDEQDAELAKQIRELMFTFEDLAILDKKAMQKLLTGFDIGVLARALKAADPAVEANFIANMAKRVQQMLAEERELIEAVTVEEVTQAQKEIMVSVRAMIDSGEVQIPRKGQANAKPK